MFIDIVNGKPKLVHSTNNDELITCMYLSLNIVYGSWWLNPSFGLKKDRLRKLSANTVSIAKDVVAEAFQWMIDAGKAKSFDIKTSLDKQEINKLYIEVVAHKPNGKKVAFSQFMSVV